MNQKVGLIKELKRRNVFKVAIAYVVSSWLLAQVADLVLENFGAPDWTMRALLIALAIGFPIALVISYVYEVTSKGVIAESEIDRTISITDQSGKRLDLSIIIILAIIIVFMGLERFVFSGHKSVRPTSNASENIDTTMNDSGGTLPADIAVAPSVAVLPFAVMSNGPDDNYFADGLTEEIINALAQLPELMVTARTSAFHFKNQNIPVGDIATQLGVKNIVEGSVRRAGDQLRITAQLVRAEDGFHLWSESYDRRTEDTLVVQQDIAEKVATALNVVLDENQRERMLQAGIRNVEAFTAYQKGIELYASAHNVGADIRLLRMANEQFEHVFKLVPDVTRAYTTHSDLYSHILISHAAGKLDGNITDADVEASPTALQLDYDRAVETASNDGQRRIAEYDRALLLGQWRGLSTGLERALAADVCALAVWTHLAAAPFGYAEMLSDEAGRILICDPLVVRGQVHQARSQLWLGEPELAQQLARKFLQNTDHHWFVWTEFLALAMQGEFEAARIVIMEKPLTSAERPYALSMLAALRGDAQLASAYQDDYLNRNGPDDISSVIMEAAKGNRNEANRIATMVDGRSFGYLALLQIIYECTCGAPFDLEYTPNFAGMLQDSGLRWPPIKPINFPLKNW